MGERHMRIEISDFVMRTFVLKGSDDEPRRETAGRVRA